MAEPIADLRIDLVDEEASGALGVALGDTLRPGDVVLLEGDLGAGKTFLVGHIVGRLLEQGSEASDILVPSPTFTLVNEYEGAATVLHADLYRLRDGSDVFALGLHERVGQDAVVLVEWGERFFADLEPVALVVRIALGEDEAREVVIEAYSTRGAEILRAIASHPTTPIVRTVPADP